MRVIGPRKNDTEFELDPVRAWRRARAMDAQLKGSLPPHPRGIFRGPHSMFNAMDRERELQIARRVNGQ